MKLILMHVGRIFLALYFLIPGISKFTSWNTSVALMEAHNMKMIPTLLAIAGIAQVVGSISLLLNRYYRNTVFALSGLMLGALNKMWPWQFDGTNYLPNDFSKSLGIENYMELSILFILISFILP